MQLPSLPLAPIALFTYSRPLYTSKVLDHLAANPEAKDSVLYVFCDGAKENSSNETITLIKANREIVRKESRFKEVIVIEEKRNKGLSASIIDGVTSLCKTHWSVIILEDDILTSPFFLRYMNEALFVYKDEESASSISGYWYPIKNKFPETFFLQDASCWGWATWARAWKNFEADGAKLYAEIMEKKLSKGFDIYGTRYTLMLKYQIEGVNDSWAIRWDAGNFLSNRMSLYPGKSLVQNIGFDGSGVHCPDINYYDVDLMDRAINVKLLPVEESQLAKRTLIQFYTDMKRDIKKKKIIEFFKSYIPEFFKNK